MIRFFRTAVIAPGQFGAAMAWAAKVGQHIKSKHGVSVEVLTPIGGNPSRVAWAHSYENLGAFETALATLMADPGYLKLLGEAGDLFVAGGTHDEIWRTA